MLLQRLGGATTFPSRGRSAREERSRRHRRFRSARRVRRLAGTELVDRRGKFVERAAVNAARATLFPLSEKKVECEELGDARVTLFPPSRWTRLAERLDRMWDASRMPWVPELFTAPALQSLEEKRHRKFETVPFFDGIVTGEVDALTGSFAGEPELYHPVRGRIRGRRAFEAYIADTRAWLAERHVSIDEVRTIHAPQHACGEGVLHLDGDTAPVDVPVAIAADRQSDGRLLELRVYYSSWPLNARHTNREPVLQPDPKLRDPDVVADYQRALSAGDVEAIVATFEPDGYAREPAGARFVHQGHDALRAFYERMFSNDGGIPLEHCTLIDDGKACALEYNVVRWGKTELPPQAGIAVYVRGDSGKLAAARIYDDVNPPIGSRK